MAVMGPQCLFVWHLSCLQQIIASGEKQLSISQMSFLLYWAVKAIDTHKESKKKQNKKNCITLQAIESYGYSMMVTAVNFLLSYGSSWIHKNMIQQLICE